MRKCGLEVLALLGLIAIWRKLRIIPLIFCLLLGCAEEGREEAVQPHDPFPEASCLYFDAERVEMSQSITFHDPATNRTIVNMAEDGLEGYRVIVQWYGQDWPEERDEKSGLEVYVFLPGDIWMWAPVYGPSHFWAKRTEPRRVAILTSNLMGNDSAHHQIEGIFVEGP